MKEILSVYKKVELQHFLNLVFPRKRRAHSLLLEKSECLFCKHDSAILEAQTEDYIYESTKKIFNFVKCSECGHIYLNPRPKIKDISIIYPKNYASFSGKFSTQNPILTKIKDTVLLSRFSTFGAKLPENSKIRDWLWRWTTIKSN